MNFDLQSSDFWDPESLHKEMVRVFEVCHACRVCYTLCPSFVKLFEVTDGNAGIFGQVEELRDDEINPVVDLCFQCKICDPICPYTPPHPLDLDFPRTLIRYNLVRNKNKKPTLQQKMFADTDGIGKLSSYFAPLVNWVNRNKFFRAQMEKYLGIHKDRMLPTFHWQTFEKWFRNHRPSAPPRKHDEKVVLFYTCTVNYNDPDIGKAAVAVFEKNGIECVVPKQQCCGLPFVDQSMLDPFMEKVKANVATLSAYVKKGYKIIAPSASCSYMLKHDYPDYLRTDDCKLVAQNTYDLSEYLIMLHEQKKLDLDFTEQVGQVRYHQPCHLMAQNIGFKAQELLKLIPGADVRRLQACSGHDGSWSVKKEYFEESMKVGRPLFNFMKAGGENCQCTSDCPLSAI